MSSKDNKKTKMNAWEKLSEERKKLQAEGLIPEWYTTAGLQMFNKSYAVKGEKSVRGRFETIAKTLSKYMGDKAEEYEKKFFDLLWEGILSPASPVLANTGTNRGMNVSCSGQFVHDSVDGFYASLRETALLSKYAFGTSGDFSSIRPRGTPFGDGGKANGVSPVIDDFFTCAANISQGSQRRGAFAAYLDIEHGDFDEVIDKLVTDPNGRNIGWTVRNSFIEKLKKGDKEAHRRYQKTLYTKLVTGKGYFFFVDKVNDLRPQAYKNNNLEVKASNLCVVGDTQIFTDVGYITIREHVGETVNVWNGSEFSEVKIAKTGENQKVVKVVTSSGFELECTPYHKFYVVTNRNGGVVEKRAHELRVGDKLIKLETPVIEGVKKLEKAYENGFYTGDGCSVEGKSRVYLYGEKRDLFHLFEYPTSVITQDKQNRIYFNVGGLKEKYFVPDSSYDVQSRLTWFAGLLDSDGCLCTEKEFGSQTLQIASTEEGFLESVQLMLQTLGIQSKVILAREAGDFLLPANNGTGDLKLFPCKKVNRLLVNGAGVHKLLNLGMTTHRLKISNRTPKRDASAYNKVVGVVDEGKIADTYCFNEPKRHMGVFNGLLTGNCNEIHLFSDEDHSYSCILSSLNLVHWDKIKETDAVFTATVFLDCLTSNFLENSAGISGLEKVRAFTEKGRAVGLGVMGYHTYLQSKMIPYESLEAGYLNMEMVEHMQGEAKRASKYLAELYGEPEWCKGTGMRNTHLLALPPTKSTASLMGGVSESFFPEYGYVYESASAAGEQQRIPYVLLNLMKERGVYNDETLKDIVEHLGSVQHVDWLSKEEKQVFKNAFEIDQMLIVRRAAQRQKYICQGQSLNLYFAGGNQEEDISQVMTEVFTNPMICGQYYFYSRSGAVIKDECISCSG